MLYDQYANSLNRLALSYLKNTADADGYRHTLIIGGTPEDWGYAEYIWLDHCRSGHISVKGEKPQWLINAEAELNSEF